MRDDRLRLIFTCCHPALALNVQVALTLRLLGGLTDLGTGTASAYAEANARHEPTAIGVVFSAGALEGLPADGSDYHHCFDKNQDGTVDRGSECLHGYEYVLPLPDALARRADVPFKWVLLNWNPVGHVPPGVYDVKAEWRITPDQSDLALGDPREPLRAAVFAALETQLGLKLTPKKVPVRTIVIDSVEKASALDN